jgi:hypothetical protein
MNAHTPGPWQVEARKGETWVCRADSAILARVGAAKEQRANARLMAAAPDMLATLKDSAAALLNAMEVTQTLSPGATSYLQGLQIAYAACRGAIAQAEGV